MLRGQHAQHPVVAGDVHCQMVSRHVQPGMVTMVRLLNEPFEQRQHVVGQHRHGKAEQRRSRMALNRPVFRGGYLVRVKQPVVQCW